MKLNRVQEALELATESVQIYRTAGTSQDTADALRDYAITLVAAGRLKDAVAALDEAWDIFHQGGFNHFATVTRLQQAELLLEIGSVTAAYDQAHEIKKHCENLGLIAGSARASLVMASALIERAKDAKSEQENEQRSLLLQEATHLCEQITSLAAQHNLQEQAYRSHHLLGKLAILREDFMGAERHYQRAITQIEDILDNLVHDLYPAFLRTTWGVYEDMIALYLQQAKSEQAFHYLERARSLALLQYLKKTRKSLSQKSDGQENISPSLRQIESASVLRMQHELGQWKQKYHDYGVQLADASLVEREKIQAELTRCEAKISELFERLHLYRIETHSTVASDRILEGKLHHIEYTDIAQLRQHLSPGQLVLIYFLHKGKLVIFALTTEQLVIHENPEGEALLERLLPPLYAHLEPKGWPDPQRPLLQAIRRPLQKLYQALIAPMAALLPPQSGSLTIVPYGLLHNLPFHALHDGSRFLIEDFQINYLPATHLLTHFESQKSTSTPKPPLIFGYSGEGRLPRALEEAKTLATMMVGHCYLEQEATIVSLVEQAPGSPIVHLATHGQRRPDAPNFSYVRLADGQLNAIDAFGLDLQECELVTLSGCETGFALSSGGDEQLGLGRAFLAAGASSLVMSLWPVEDDATNELMKLFYQHLMNGESKVQALRAAQCDLLHRKSSAYPHPYFWAAFHLVGAVGPLTFVHTKYDQ